MEGIVLRSILAFTYVVSYMYIIMHKTTWIVRITRIDIIHLVPEVREGGLIYHELLELGDMSSIIFLYNPICIFSP